MLHLTCIKYRCVLKCSRRDDIDINVKCGRLIEQILRLARNIESFLQVMTQGASINLLEVADSQASQIYKVLSYKGSFILFFRLFDPVRCSRRKIQNPNVMHAEHIDSRFVVSAQKTDFLLSPLICHVSRCPGTR